MSKIILTHFMIEKNCISTDDFNFMDRMQCYVFKIINTEINMTVHIKNEYCSKAARDKSSGNRRAVLP